MTVLNQITQARASRLRQTQKVERQTRSRAGIAALAAVSDGLFGKREQLVLGRFVEFSRAAVAAAAPRRAA